MDKKMYYQYMERLLDIKMNVESIKFLTELAIEGAKIRAGENEERLLMCYCVYLGAIEQGLKICINDIDHAIVAPSNNRRGTTV